MTAEVHYDGFGSWVVADDHHQIIGYYGSPEVARAACNAHNTRSTYRAIYNSSIDELYDLARRHVAAKTAGAWWAGLTEDERSEVATAVAMRSGVVWREVMERFDALADEWRVAQAAEAAQAAQALPPVGALCEALATLAASAPTDAYARACERAAGAVVRSTEMRRDDEGDLVVGSTSEPGRVWRVNAHGCTCRAAHGACWHVALRDAVVMAEDEKEAQDAVHS